MMKYLKSYNPKLTHLIREAKRENRFDEWIKTDVEDILRQIGDEVDGGKIEAEFNKQMDGGWLLEFTTQSVDEIWFFSHQITLLVSIAKYMAEKSYKVCIIPNLPYGFSEIEIEHGVQLFIRGMQNEFNRWRPVTIEFYKN